MNLPSKSTIIGNLQQQNSLNERHQRLRKSLIARRNLEKDPHRQNPSYNYHIFAYCSKNYLDAYEFVIDSWIRSNVLSITIYTDFDHIDLKRPTVRFIRIFEEHSAKWITGTGRRLDVIKHYNESFQSDNKNILFMDIDCLIVSDPSQLFGFEFDMAISRLSSKESYSDQTATAGLWFAKYSDRYLKFCDNWINLADVYLKRGKGILDHRISYVQYSFTDVAKKYNDQYSIFAIDEKVYNSEHSTLNKWYHDIRKYQPKILHFKGRRFRDSEIIHKTREIVSRYKHNDMN